MKQTWILLCFAVCCAFVIVAYTSIQSAPEQVLIPKDAYDPLHEIIEPFPIDHLEMLSPYILAHRIPNLRGVAFILGSQAMSPRSANPPLIFKPLYYCSVVFAVNKNNRAADLVDSWQSLLSSTATVLIPDQGTESGRLTAIALAKGLGASDGDLRPAIQAYKMLESSGRLNSKKEYSLPEYRNVYRPNSPNSYDVVLMWDYQAEQLRRQSGQWEIITPSEGTVTVEAGYISSADLTPGLIDLVDYFDSEEGKKALEEKGFAISGSVTDLSGWNEAKLLFNPIFRRAVRQEKLYSPASVRERLLLNFSTIILFCLAAVQVVRRVPQGKYRQLSIVALLLVLLWMITGLLKAMSVQHEYMRIFWFASYISRHALPVIWLTISYYHRHERTPDLKPLTVAFAISALLSIMVLTNDLHQQVFIYLEADPRTWEHQYIHGWGYYLSLIWSFALSLYGVLLILKSPDSRLRLRQYLYALAFFVLLFAYQFAYIIGIPIIFDLDIPSTVGIIIMLFLIVNQQSRFMGEQLLALPAFYNSIHGFAILNKSESAVYVNKTGESILASLSSDTYSKPHNHIITNKGKYYTSQRFSFKKGEVLVYEDITELKNLEKQLEIAGNKLQALNELLSIQQANVPDLISQQETQRYNCQIDLLLSDKLSAARCELAAISALDLKINYEPLIKARFLVSICQQRLRTVIDVLSAGNSLSGEKIIGYAHRIIKQGRRRGLDGIFTCTDNFALSIDVLPKALDTIDLLCLIALELKNSSLVCRLQEDASKYMLTAFIEIPTEQDSDMINDCKNKLELELKKIYESSEVKDLEDGLSVVLFIANKENAV